MYADYPRFVIPLYVSTTGKSHSINTSAILNLLDLRSIMGCPGSTGSVFSRSFPAKREVQCIFLGKKAFVITPKDGTTIFFSHFNLFLEKLKNWPESERKY